MISQGFAHPNDLIMTSDGLGTKFMHPSPPPPFCDSHGPTFNHFPHKEIDIERHQYTTVICPFPIAELAVNNKFVTSMNKKSVIINIPGILKRLAKFF